MASALPTRKDEAFRYADLAALERVWPVATETIALAAGEARAGGKGAVALTAGQEEGQADRNRLGRSQLLQHFQGCQPRHRALGKLLA